MAAIPSTNEASSGPFFTPSHLADLEALYQSGILVDSHERQPSDQPNMDVISQGILPQNVELQEAEFTRLILRRSIDAEDTDTTIGETEDACFSQTGSECSDFETEESLDKPDELEDQIKQLHIEDESGAYLGPATVYPQSELGNQASARRLWEQLEGLSLDTPVFPRCWALDFADQFVPRGLFQEAQPSQVPAIYGHDQGTWAHVKATKRIIALMDLNDRVVGMKQIGNTENIPGYIWRELRTYLKWSEKDGGLNRLEAGHSATEIKIVDGTQVGEEVAVTKRILRSLVKRADKMRDNLFLGVAGDNVAFQGTCVPTIYTWVIVGNMAKVFTVDPKNPLRTIQELIEIDFGIQGHSLWNAIRVAMIMCQARDEMMGIKMLIPENKSYALLQQQEAMEDM